MKHLLLFTFLCTFCGLAFGVNGISIVNLQCEYLPNPLGIDSPHPRLTWVIHGDSQNCLQTHYQILVNTDSIALKKGEGRIWDSGEIPSSSQLINYEGQGLKPFTKYYWEVKVQIQDQKTPYLSGISSFETGMMSSANWQGSWISDDNTPDYKPAPYFRKEINLSKKVASARIYIATAGLYELSVNGKKVGDRMLDPMYTRFDRRTLYSSFDVTFLIKQGNNALGLLLGNGWYNHQSTAVWYFHKAPWRNRPRVCLNLRIAYTDGSTETFVTDSSWKTADSPVIFNSIYTAEHYDARKEIPGWDSPGLNDSGWKKANITSAPSQNIVSQQMQPIRIIKKIKAKSIRKINDSCYVYTFPQNIAGVVDISIQGKPGTQIRLKHGEKLYQNGRVDQSNIDLHYRPKDNSDPFQTDIFLLSGRKDHFSPRFNYKGFQYVEVHSSEPMNFILENLTALMLHSDVPPIGSIHSSNPVLNKIWEATNNSYLSNLFGYPTDCPQREKNGWTGDSHIAVETGLYGFDAITVYEKWMSDFQDEMKENGVLPNIVPTSGWGYDWGNGPDWTSTVAIIPWQIYQFYGDSHLLQRMYGHIKRYVDHVHEVSPNDTTNWGLGDWVPVKTVSSKTLTSSLYYYADVRILAKAATLFGKKEDSRYYTDLANRIKNAINANFLNRETGIYCSGSQTEQAAPLYWGIVPDELKAQVASKLFKQVEADNFHVNTGILGAKALLNALSENGYADAAYKIASQESYPSWGHWIKQGATTLYENWSTEASVHDASLNHIMFGDINAWMYKALGGILIDENNPGFKHIILKPNFVEGLNQFESRHQSPYGTIVSGWKRISGKIQYDVTIPDNSTATLISPKGKQELLPGRYTFTF